VLVFGGKATEDQYLYEGYQTVLSDYSLTVNTVLKVRFDEGKRRPKNFQ